MNVGRFIIRRLLFLIPVLVGISILTFLISHVIPGDPARLVAGRRRRRNGYKPFERSWAWIARSTSNILTI